LGVPVEWVRVATPLDTDYSPYEWQTVASRLTWSMGNAWWLQLKMRASRSWKCRQSLG
jgi:CO/xanthine dehydrogenase Mo-binding subunit